MAKRKEHNSIFFLTVYFGLLLVSTTPQVLARAAANPIFDIKNEIEFKEDLDNKPDENLAPSHDELSKEISFASDLLTKFFSKDFNENFPVFSHQSYFANLKFDENVFSKRFRYVDSFFEHNKSFTANLNSEKNTLQSYSEQENYKSIKITSENNQVFIVTRLPRAAIDTLLQTASL